MSPCQVVSIKNLKIHTLAHAKINGIKKTGSIQAAPKQGWFISQSKKLALLATRPIARFRFDLVNHMNMNNSKLTVSPVVTINICVPEVRSCPYVHPFVVEKVQAFRLLGICA